jgi:hypothetical protein
MPRQLAVEFGEDVSIYCLVHDVFAPVMPLDMERFQDGNPFETWLDDILEHVTGTHEHNLRGRR